MTTLTCGFIGLGLIGGSIAKALKAFDADACIIAYDVNTSSLAEAKKDGIVDIPCASVDAHFTQCDYIFLCAPVSHNDANLIQVKEVLSPNCILTDVGSVKSTTLAHVREAGLAASFIGGHPMAGSERIGYANSKSSLLEKAFYILTPTEEVSAQKVASLQKLVEKMGAIPLVLESGRHDYVTAAVSHLPHVIAASLVNLVRESDSEDEIMKKIAAGGFKDITRIASSSPVMWQQICLTNKDNISRLLARYIEALSAAKTAIDNEKGDELYALFNSARTYRNSFSNTSSGPIKRIYDMTVEIADKPGALAAIVTLLAEHGLNIKNIGITHNREAAEGSMNIEFYEEKDLFAAQILLAAEGASGAPASDLT